MTSFHALCVASLYDTRKAALASMLRPRRKRPAAARRRAPAKRQSRLPSGGDGDGSSAAPLPAPRVLELEERVDMAMLERIDARRAELLPHGEAGRFRTYAAEMRAGNGVRKVVYRQAAHAIGRVYADGALSLANFSKPLRSALARELYVDIDIPNAHPRILLALARKHGWPAACLERYIEQRDAVIGELPYPEPVSKQIFLAIVMCGSRHSVLRRAKLRDAGTSEFAERFKAEVNELAKRIHGQYTDHHRAIRANSERPYASCLSFVLQDIEMRAIVEACDYLEAHDWDIGALIHDGFLVRRRDAELLQIDAELLGDMRAHVLRELGVDLPFAVKEWPEPLKVEDE